MDSIGKKSLNSAFWYTASNLIAKGFIIWLTPIYARLLSPGEYGAYSNFTSWQSILAILLTFELSSTVLRANFDFTLSKYKDYIACVAAFSVVFPIFTGLTLLLIFNQMLTNFLGLSFYQVLKLCIIIGFSSVLPIYQAEQRALLKYKLSSILTLGYGISTFIIPLILILSSTNRIDAIINGIMINAILWGFGIFVVLCYGKKSFMHQEYLKYALVIALPIVPHLLAGSIMGNSDKVMINKFCGSSYAALYSVAFTCATAVTLLKNSLNAAWAPWFYAKLEEKNYAVIKKISNYYIDIFSIGSILLCLLGPEIILVLGGKLYLDAMWILPVLMLSCYFNFLYTFYVNIEFYEKKTINISKITIITSVINVVMNYIGIRLFGYIAAAYTTAFSTLLNLLFHYITTKSMNNAAIYCNKKILINAISGIMFVILIMILYLFYIARCALICCICIIIVYKLYTLRQNKVGEL